MRWNSRGVGVPAQMLHAGHRTLRRGTNHNLRTRRRIYNNILRVRRVVPLAESYWGLAELPPEASPFITQEHESMSPQDKPLPHALGDPSAFLNPYMVAALHTRCIRVAHRRKHER